MKYFSYYDKIFNITTETKGCESCLKKFFKDTGNFLSFALALIPAIILFIFQPTTAIPYSVFAIVVLLLMLFAWLVAKLYLSSKDISHPAIELFKCSSGKCLCRPNPYLSHHSAVSFYKDDNGFENFLCYGYVETITEKGMVQIVIVNDNDGKHFSYISTHQNDIIIKPVVSIEALSDMH